MRDSTAVAEPINGRLDAILSRLDDVKQVGSEQWQARCPAHQDDNPSLSIGIGHEERILLSCHAGCTVEQVCEAIQIKVADLYPNGKAKRQIVATYDYRGVEGDVLCQKVRYSPKGFSQRRPDGNGDWIWNLNGVRPVLYRLPELRDAVENDPDQWLFLVEGEKDVDRLVSLGLVATTNIEGAKGWSDEYSETLRGLRVALVADNDKAGHDRVETVASRCHGISAAVRVIHLPGLQEKGDVSDWLDGGGTADDLLILVNGAADWVPKCNDDDQPADDEIPDFEETMAVEQPAPKIIRPKFHSVRELTMAHQKLREPIIEGLLRKGETLNVIAPPKRGKSWLTADLAIAVATGRKWLQTYDTVPGDVLVIDNELHRETTANRIPRVARERGIGLEEYGDRLFVDNLRGRLVNIFEMRSYFNDIPKGRFQVVVLDALYRFMPEGRGESENDNGLMARIYNEIDKHADRIGCCFVLIHHSSKGHQSNKAVTDVGAGAGSQSRATDSHLVIRDHEEEGVVVLEAVARSWPPPEPLCLRWTWPVFNPVELDPTRLRSDRQRRDANSPWTIETFIDAFISAEPQSKPQILVRVQEVTKGNLSERKAERLLDAAIDGHGAHVWKPKNRKLPYRYATIPEPAPELKIA